LAEIDQFFYFAQHPFVSTATYADQPKVDITLGQLALAEIVFKTKGVNDTLIPSKATIIALRFCHPRFVVDRRIAGYLSRLNACHLMQFGPMVPDFLQSRIDMLSERSELSRIEMEQLSNEMKKLEEAMDALVKALIQHLESNH